LLYIFPIGFFAFLAVLIIVLWLARKLPFPLKATLSNKIPLVVHYPTGRISVKLVKEGEGYLQLDKNTFVALPTVKRAEPGEQSEEKTEDNPGTKPQLSDFLDVRSFWEGINRPAYFMDLRKAVSVTPKIWNTLSRAFKTISEKTEQISLYPGEFLKPDDIIQAIRKMFKPSVIRTISLESEEIGRQEAGVNWGRVASIFSIGIVGVMLIIVLYGLFIQ